MLATIAEIADPSRARVLIAALRAHGFNPEDGADGLPGLPGVYGARGVAIRVPEAEAADARLLAEALLAEMEN
jgi:hypothetical protein